MIHIKTFVFGMCETNCYLIYDQNKNCVVVDCDGDGVEVEKYIDENHFKLTHILLTHGHSDHIGAVKKLKDKFKCKICIGENEEDVLEDPNFNLSAMMGGQPISLRADCFLKNGEFLKAGSMTFRVINTPGHTKGSICYIVEDNLITGDTLFAGSCGRTDLATGDWGTIIKSLRKLSALEGDYKVFPGHGPSTTLDYERKTNMYLK